MRQMQSWIESTVDEELSKPPRIFLFSPDLLLDDLPLELASEIESLGCSLLRLKSIADLLGIGEGSFDEDMEASADKSLAKPRGPRARVPGLFNGMN